MFLRSKERTKDGKTHRYWSLVETVRTESGPRQRTVCFLGELNDPAQKQWRRTIEVFNAQGESQQLSLFPSEDGVVADEQTVRVVLGGVRMERSRQFGNCFIGLELWKRLKLDRFFEGLLDESRADVSWSRIAAVLAINRLCDPGSELAIQQRWYPATALDDLLDIPDGKVDDSRLYRCLDRLIPHKTKIERHLRERYGELFSAEFDVLLYDLTSTYVEGQAEANPMMKRGYSRDHRPDCKQVLVALIVNTDGFPLSYETFDGNRRDVTTLEAVLRMVERKHGKARRIWVFDRGIISEENLAALRRRGGQYLCGTMRSQLQKFEKQLLDGKWTTVQGDVEVQQIPISSGEETYILCRSDARKTKETAIRLRFSSSMEKALQKLAKRIDSGRLKDRLKIERALGSLQARHPSVKDLYKMAIIEREGALHLDWSLIEERRKWRDAREGAYLLRTNLKDDKPEELWKKYIQLTEAEAAFRALKSELSIRPIFHQVERRVKAHILVAFLGYALWVTLKQLLKAAHSDLSPAKALALLSTLNSADIVLPTTDGRQIRLRRITQPDTQQQLLLHQLGVHLPDRLRSDFQM
jgi:transposase